MAEAAQALPGGNLDSGKLSEAAADGDQDSSQPVGSAKDQAVEGEVTTSLFGLIQVPFKYQGNIDQRQQKQAGAVGWANFEVFVVMDQLRAIVCFMSVIYALVVVYFFDVSQLTGTGGVIVVNAGDLAAVIFVVLSVLVTVASIYTGNLGFYYKICEKITKWKYRGSPPFTPAESRTQALQNLQGAIIFYAIPAVLIRWLLPMAFPLTAEEYFCLKTKGACGYGTYLWFVASHGL